MRFKNEQQRKAVMANIRRTGLSVGGAWVGAIAIRKSPQIKAYAQKQTFARKMLRNNVISRESFNTGVIGQKLKFNPRREASLIKQAMNEKLVQYSGVRLGIVRTVHRPHRRTPVGVKLFVKGQAALHRLPGGKVTERLIKEIDPNTAFMKAEILAKYLIK